TVYVKKSSYRTENGKYHDCVNPEYHPVIRIKMTNEPVLKKLKDTFGGSFYKEKKIHLSVNGFTTRKLLWSWAVSDRKCIAVCNAILPFSIIKRENIQNLIDLYNLKQEARKKRESNGKFQGQPFKKEWVEKFEACHKKSKELNA
ncbi:MAG: hypothetical protein ACYDEZ_09020, partial [Methanoregula sp.]